MSYPRGSFEQNAYYEHITRLARWLVILIVVVTFPMAYSKAPIVYLGLAIVSAYNLTRYIPALMRIPALASPIGGLIVDNLLVGGIIYLVGSISTPYGGLLIINIIVAIYRTGTRGLVTVIAFQSLILLGAAMFNPGNSEPLPLSALSVALAAIGEIGLIGFLIGSFTHRQRARERDLVEVSGMMEAEQERLATLISSLPDAILVLDEKSRLLLANGVAQELMGNPPQWKDKELDKFLLLRPRTKPTAKPVNILEAGTNAQHRRDLFLTKADKTTVDLDLSVTPVRMASGGKSNYIVVGRDITKERSLDRQREEFIAVASHELRTPLAIVEVALSTALLDKKTLPSRSSDLMEQAYRNVVFLAALVKDLTTLSEAQNDNLPISLKPVDATALLRQLGIDFQQRAEAKKLPLQIVVAPDTPSILSTEHYIHEVLQNYLTNALKYTEKGHITLLAKPSQSGGVRFGVSDTGEGISATDQQHLFTKFFRAEDYKTRATGGTGLGLYLCLELAQRLNAKVWCESKEGEGSTFYLEVPPFSQLRQDHGKVVEAQVSSLVDQL